jgi:hypothetical protein
MAGSGTTIFYFLLMCLSAAVALVLALFGFPRSGRWVFTVGATLFVASFIMRRLDRMYRREQAVQKPREQDRIS